LCHQKGEDVGIHRVARRYAESSKRGKVAGVEVRPALHRAYRAGIFGEINFRVRGGYYYQCID
jgi:hypothetical protein